LDPVLLCRHCSTSGAIYSGVPTGITLVTKPKQKIFMRTNEKMFENVKPHLPLALFIADFYKKKQEQCIFYFTKP